MCVREALAAAAADVERVGSFKKLRALSPGTAGAYPACHRAVGVAQVEGAWARDGPAAATAAAARRGASSISLSSGGSAALGACAGASSSSSLSSTDSGGDSEAGAEDDDDYWSCEGSECGDAPAALGLKFDEEEQLQEAQEGARRGADAEAGPVDGIVQVLFSCPDAALAVRGHDQVQRPKGARRRRSSGGGSGGKGPVAGAANEAAADAPGRGLARVRSWVCMSG
jgi:hypothetical protein